MDGAPCPRYSISASSAGSNPDRLVRDFPGIGLGFPDQRRQPLSQVGGGFFIEAVVDLAGI